MRQRRLEVLARSAKESTAMSALLFVPLLAFLATFTFTIRSLGLGLVVVFIVGYANGVVRANFLSVYTTFMFDASLLGLYAGFMVGWPRETAEVLRGPAGKWVLTLILWPVLLSLVPVNDYFVQLVALRATVWFLPVLLIASRLRAADLDTLTRGLAVLNLVALGGGIYVYINGVESLYPENPVTQIIYKSNDVAGYQYHRVPSIFLSSHSYGGTMLFTLPFLLERVFGRGARPTDRALAVAGIGAAVAGILMCAARQPVIVFGAMMVVGWMVARFHLGIGLVAVGLTAVALGVATGNERLQRAITLEDTEFVSERVRASANESFLDLMVQYPAGAGMGSAVGTSIPYFLADRAPTAIGLENEYSRILVDQGIVGLGLWLAFLVWLLHRPPPFRLDVPWGLGVVFMFALVSTNWLTAFIGAGMLSAVPTSVLLLVQMGILVRVREVATGARE
jgi:hypothetical protein